MNKVHSLEDPPEYLISSSCQTAVRRGDENRKLQPRKVDVSISPHGLLESLGAAVAYEREDGSMALSTWDGESMSVWAKLDVNPAPSLFSIRQHMIDAVPLSDPRPPGYIRVICFVQQDLDPHI